MLTFTSHHIMSCHITVTSLSHYITITTQSRGFGKVQMEIEPFHWKVTWDRRLYRNMTSHKNGWHDRTNLPGGGLIMALD